MSELPLLILRFGFLALLWVFVFVIVYAMRSDLFGQRVRKMRDPANASAPAATGAAGSAANTTGATTAPRAATPAPAPAPSNTVAPGAPAPSASAASAASAGFTGLIVGAAATA